MKAKMCPFKIADKVIYTPSQRGAALDVNVPSSDRLEIGRQYTVKEIINEIYVVVEAYSHPAGGLHWSEFSYPHLVE